MTAIADPFGPVLDAAWGNIQTLIARVAGNPAPILAQVVANQWASGQIISGLAEAYVKNFLTYFTGDQSSGFHAQLALINGYLESGQYGLAFGQISAMPLNILGGGNILGIFNVIAEAVSVVQKPFGNIDAALGVLTNPRNLVPLGLALVQTVNITAQRFGQGLEGVEAAMQTGELDAVIDAALTGAAGTLDSVQLGLVGPTGLVNAVLTLRDQIATAIKPPAAMNLKLAVQPVNELPSSAVTLVSLPTPEGASEHVRTADEGTRATLAGTSADIAADKDAPAATLGLAEDGPESPYAALESGAAEQVASVVKRAEVRHLAGKKAPGHLASLLPKGLKTKPGRTGAIGAHRAGAVKRQASTSAGSGSGSASPTNGSGDAD
ncbi:hypothetical protein [Mycolicibacterium conceptionense]|uniref:hypothetical protein n=1 Tax=Mycolicibacterium conceptionense TaxID=451644 RepID=UPI001055DFD4|nr:hypothetical protein [Mycolicibacterium conceptionense]